MYRIGLFSLGVVLVSVVMGAPETDDKHKCKHFMHHGYECCNRKPHKFDFTPNEEVKECFKMHKNNHTDSEKCELAHCVLAKMGFTTSDGKVDKKKIIDDLEQEFQDEKEFIDLLKENCVDDVSKYGKKDLCDVMKIHLCTGIQYVKSCPEWKDDANCKGMKDLAVECIGEIEN